MKNFLLSVIAIIVFSAILQPFMPWYVIAIVAFCTGYLVQQSSIAAFASGFIAMFLLWTVYAGILSHANGDLLARKVATLIPLGGNVIVLLVITGFIGGLVSGLASLTGRLAASE